MANTLGVCAMYAEGYAVVLVLGADARMPVSVLLIKNDPPCTEICSRNLQLRMRGVYVCARVSTNPSPLAFLPTPPLVLVLGADARLPVSVLLLKKDPPCTEICSRNLPLCMRGVYLCARVSTNPSPLTFLPTPPPPPPAAHMVS